MADDEKPEFRPERTENILHGGTSTDRPGIFQGSSSTDFGQEEKEGEGGDRDQDDEDDEDEIGELSRVQTTRTVTRERTFEPILPGDKEALTRLASNFSAAGGSLTRTDTRGSELQRSDTLAGIQIGDAVLDPRSPEFDVYKWSRM
jgi:ATP-binding cassette subfamily G (WHITE) protein 2 (PDR)